MHRLEARINMIKQQLRTWQVTDETLIECIESLPREHFVPKGFESIAYSDFAIPLTDNEIMLPPQIVGRALQLLEIKRNETVLEIGTGTGYITALLVKLAAHVYSKESNSALFSEARSRLEPFNFPNLTLELGDGHLGWPAHALYDCIFVTGAYPLGIPDELKSQIRDKGRIFAFTGVGSTVQGQLFTRESKTKWHVKTYFETAVPCLDHAALPPSFSF